MPVLLHIVELVDLYTFQILFFFAHLDDVYTLQSQIRLLALILSLISCVQLVHTKNSFLIFRTQLLFLYLQSTSRTLLDIQPDVYKCVEKLQFFLDLDLHSPEIYNTSWLSWCSVLKITCLHVSFTAYENFYKLSKMHCLLVLTFHFPIFRISEYRNPTVKHISTYTLVSSSISTHVTDLFLGSNSHSKPFSECQGLIQV